MSYQAYLDTIKQKTGKSPEDFRALAEQKGLLQPHVKAGEVVAGSRRSSAWVMVTPWRCTGRSGLHASL
jgi:hypothetical protein